MVRGVCAVPNGTRNSFFPISRHSRAGLQIVASLRDSPSWLKGIHNLRATPESSAPEATPTAAPGNTVSKFRQTKNLAKMEFLRGGGIKLRCHLDH
jgi:hypothetical protein